MSPVFLTALNFANFFNQAATLIVLAMGLVFVLVLAEIDLSAGVTSGVSAALLVITLHHNINWILAILVAVAAGVLIGYFIGLIVARIGIPSFVVTLACFLAFQGLQLLIIGNGGLFRIENSQVLAIQNSNLTILQGWIFYAIGILLYIYSGFAARRRRSRNNQPNRPIVFLYLRIVFALITGAAIVAALNLERSSNEAFPIHGVPIVIPVVIVLFVIGTFVLDRTIFGRHVYAVGGNPEAARRAGIRVTGVKIAVFTICSTTAAISGIIGASRIGSVDASMGRTSVLNGVAAAVVGGVSLFGGKGRLSQAVIGGFVIAIIDNGLGLMGYNSGINLLITGAVLLLAASSDAISRKRGSVVTR
jgi:D-xylose transport system permease protein